MRDVLSKYASTPPPTEAPAPRKAAYGKVQLDSWAPVVSQLYSLAPTAAGTNLEAPLTMEAVGQNYGFIVYSLLTYLSPANITSHTIEVTGVHDHAWVYINGSLAGSTYRGDAPKNTTFPGLRYSPVALTIVVENCGRLNYGHEMWDPKGILGDVKLDGKTLTGGWSMHSLPLDTSQLSALNYYPLPPAGTPVTGATFFRGYLQVPASDAPADTFLDMTGWTHGSVWINGFNVGRYWQARGPQRTLYVPAPLLQAGANEVLVLETDAPPSPVPSGWAVTFGDAPGFSPSQTCSASSTSMYASA